MVEAAAEILFGDVNAVIKVDCAEFQHSHEIAKLIGSPPGYLGARHLKRAIERLLVMPMSNLVASGQIGFADSIYADLDRNGSDISFARRSERTTIDNSFLTEHSAAEFAAPLDAWQLSQVAAA